MLPPRDGAVVGIDLAEDKQAIAVIDHDVRVLARKTVRVKAFRLGEALDWAVGQARAKGFDRVTVACEPTGPRWLQVQRLCAERGLPLVCIQPLVSHIALSRPGMSGDFIRWKDEVPWHVRRRTRRELRERAVRMVAGGQGRLSRRSSRRSSRWPRKLGIGSAETLRKWVRRAEIDAGAAARGDHRGVASRSRR